MPNSNLQNKYEQARNKNIKDVLLVHCGIKLPQNERSLFRCINPNHNDGTPSAHIYQNHYKCFACDWSFCSVIDIVCLMRGERLDALQAVREGRGNEATKNVIAKITKEIIGEVDIVDKPKKIIEIKTSGIGGGNENTYQPKTRNAFVRIDKVLRWYLDLGNNQQKEYANVFCNEKWGLSPEIVQSAGIVYRSATFEKELLNKHIKELSKEEFKLLCQLGLIQDAKRDAQGRSISKAWCRLADYPLKVPFIVDGLVWQVQARRIDDEKPKYRHLSISNVAFYNHSVLFDKDVKEVRVVEGASDTLVWKQSGQACVGTIGMLGSVRDIAIKHLCQNNRQKIFIVAEGDEAGQKGAQRLAERCNNYIKNQKLLTKVFIVSLPKGQDTSSIFKSTQREPQIKLNV